VLTFLDNSAWPAHLAPEGLLGPLACSSPGQRASAAPTGSTGPTGATGPTWPH
jgi:hypothetical protein